MDLRQAKFLRRVFKRRLETEGNAQGRRDLQRIRAEIKGIARDLARYLYSPLRLKALRRLQRRIMEIEAIADRAGDPRAADEPAAANQRAADHRDVMRGRSVRRGDLPTRRRRRDRGLDGILRCGGGRARRARRGVQACAEGRAQDEHERNDDQRLHGVPTGGTWRQNTTEK